MKTSLVPFFKGSTLSLVAALSMTIGPIANAQETADLFGSDSSDELSETAPGTDPFLEGITDLVPDANKKVKVSNSKPRKSEMPNPIAMVNIAPVDELGDEAEMLAVEKEAAKLDADAYTYFSKQTRQEESRLKSEISSLERDVRNSKSAAERAKKQSELAHKKLVLQETRRKEVQARFNKADREKRVSERARNRIQEKVTAAEERLRAIRARNSETQTKLVELKSENKELERRLKRATAQLRDEQKRQKSLRAQRQRLTEKNRKLKSNVTSVERKLGKNS